MHTVSDFLSVSPFWLPLVILCAVLLSLSVPAYYYAIRPRRGTTEWIKRLDPPHFAPVQVQFPGWTDILWALLTAVCAAALRFVYYFFSLRLHLKSNAMQILSSCMPQLERQMLLSVFSALVDSFDFIREFGSLMTWSSMIINIVQIVLIVLILTILVYVVIKVVNPRK